jgi:hypothetical protein
MRRTSGDRSLDVRRGARHRAAFRFVIPPHFVTP